MKEELASKQFAFTTVGLFEAFVWDLNERSRFCARLYGVRIVPR